MDNKTLLQTQSNTAQQQQPPPPYSVSAGVPASNPGPSNQSLPPTHPFPPSFNIYSISTFSHTVFALGQHQDRPLYAVSFHGGLFSSKPDLILHNGAETAAPLATADREGGAFNKRVVISVPPPDAAAASSSSAGATTVPGQQDLRVAVDENTEFLKSSSYSFSLPVGADMHVEKFEWRHSHGTEVLTLGGRSSGWKLVRVQSGEVVAAWAWNGGMSLSKKCLFAFMGSGASGELGPAWSMVAVVSMLRLFQIERRRSGGAAAGGAGGGGG